MSDMPAQSSASHAEPDRPAPGLTALVRALRGGSPSERIRACWLGLYRLPGGKRLFSWLIGAFAPYSGTIAARVESLARNHARVRMADRRRLRNHLRSLHAIALINLAEYAGNLALAYSMPDNARFIVTGIEMRYFRKARGTITAVCDQVMPTDNTRQEINITVDLFDRDGERVAQGTLVSLIGPMRE